MKDLNNKIKTLINKMKNFVINRWEIYVLFKHPRNNKINQA